MEWNPESGFQIDALLDKPFAPVDRFKTLGQIIVNTKEDTFSIRLAVRGHGKALVPVAFPLAQQSSLIPDNHLSMKVERVVFFSRWPPGVHLCQRFWSGSAEFSTKVPIEFPDHMKTECTLADKPFSGRNTTGLCVEDDAKWSIWGHRPSDERFELKWALNRDRWSRSDAWRFGEAARRALSILSAQTVWILKQDLSRGNQNIGEYRRPSETRKLSYYFHPLLGKDIGVVEHWQFNKEAFLRLTEMFLRGGLHADTCWRIFLQMADASQQKTTQGQELLLATILEAVFRSLNNLPFKAGGHYGENDRKTHMEGFKSQFLSDKWGNACTKALELHKELRHRNAHPDWLTSGYGGQSKSELQRSCSNQVFMSRFYGYMILAMAGFKDLEPRFPVVKFSD